MSALEIDMNKRSLDYRQLLNFLLQRFTDGVRLSQRHILREFNVNLRCGQE